VITGDHAFKRFLSRSSPGLTIGEHCTMDGTHFAVGAEGRIDIGDYCYFTNAVLLCELELRIGSYVVIGWNATIADTDFHPIAPADRIADAIACSPLAAGRPRPPIARRAVVIEDDVWIGPNATILKGVRLGRGLLDRARRAGRPRHAAGIPRGRQPRPAPRGRRAMSPAAARRLEGDWYPGAIPANVSIDETAYVQTSFSFHLYRSAEPEGVRIGRGASVYLGTMFDVGRQGRVAIGAFTLVNGARIVCDAAIEIGDCCLISWNVVLMDTYRLPRDVVKRRRVLQRVPRLDPRRAETGVPGRPSGSAPTSGSASMPACCPG
jgi:acetyltransferase-like isoleucine patch superfamily enzyme